MNKLAAALAFAVAAVAARADPLAEVPYATSFAARISVPTEINGRSPFNLLVDTGSSQTILFGRAAFSLGLKVDEGERIVVHSIAGTAQSPPYTLADLGLGAEHVANLPIAVLPNPDESGGPDGVLGMDVLRRYAIVFDRPSNRMMLFAPGTLPAPYNRWPYTQLSPRRLKDLPIDLWFFEARYGNERAKTLFDLGTSVTIITWQLARRLLPPSEMPSRQEDEVRDALGKGIPAFRLENLPIELARHRWDKQIALVADAPVFAFLDFAGQPAGIIGASLLKDSSFAVDFQNERLHVAPSPSAN